MRSTIALMWSWLSWMEDDDAVDSVQELRPEIFFSSLSNFPSSARTHLRGSFVSSVWDGEADHAALRISSAPMLLVMTMMCGRHPAPLASVSGHIEICSRC